VDNLGDTPRWNPEIARQTILADAHGYQKLFEQHLAGVHVVEDRGHGRASVIIHDLHSATPSF
jgi:hypothetical protein